MEKDGMNQAQEKKITSILMIGQSNMAGRGEIDDVEPIMNPNCFMMRMGRWQYMSEPINPDRPIFAGPFRSGIGLAASFADEISRHWNAPVGLIPCADGGTKLAQWMPGEVLFEHAVMMAQLAMRTSRFGGIIWHQGESDSVRGNIEEYHQNLIIMMRALRERLNAEHLPLILGELSVDTDREKWKLGDWPEKVNAALYQISTVLPNCAVASAKGLTIKPDGIHFDAKGCREFGRRYAECFISVDVNRVEK